MDFKKYNNLIELFFEKYEKQQKDKIFLSSLKDSQNSFSWEKVKTKVINFASEISKLIKTGDRCLLISENRPEWMISDLSIMLAGGITVPAYTTYTEEDYKYLIEDCEPSLVIVSNNEMLKKLNNTINEKDFIKKVITLDEIGRAHV